MSAIQSSFVQNNRKQAIFHKTEANVTALNVEIIFLQKGKVITRAASSGGF